MTYIVTDQTTAEPNVSSKAALERRLKGEFGIVRGLGFEPFQRLCAKEHHIRVGIPSVSL